MTDTTGPPEGSGWPTARERVLAGRLLLVVAASFLVVQLALLSFHRAPRWDEAVYLSQVTPGVKAQFFAPFRARGITVLIAPVTWSGGSVAAVRIYLLALSALALTGAFWVWIPFIGVAAPLAAFLFGFSWIGLLNGSEIFPNFWAAALGLAVAGLVCRRLAGGGRWPLVLAPTLLAVLALFRPTEATAVAGVLAIYVLVFARSSWRVLLPLGLGLVLGWAPWVIEMSVRFGGPLTALKEAGTAHFALTSVGGNVRRYLAYANGGIVGPEAHRITLAGALWWGWLIAMSIVALVRTRGTTARAAVLICSLGGLILAAQYVVFVSALAARYLLPGIAFLSVAAAVGVVSLIRGGLGARAAGAIVLLLVVPWAFWQAGVADRVEAQEARRDDSFRAVGLTLRQMAGDGPCSFIALHGTAEIALASRCDGTQAEDPGPTAEQLGQLSSSQYPAFLILPRFAKPYPALGTTTPVLSGDGQEGWAIYQLPS